MKHFITRDDLFKIATIARTVDGNEKVFDIAWELRTKCCLTARKKILVDEEDYKVMKPYQLRINDYDGYDKAIDELIEADDLKNEEGNGMCPFKELTWIAEDYPEKIADGYDNGNEEYSIAADICAKLGKNYQCFWTEDNMYFWDKTKWSFDSAELNFKAL